jgi:Arc/MetJ family transcription regulator
MRLYRLPTKRAAVDFALRALVGERLSRDMLDLEGAGWDGDLPRMRSTSARPGSRGAARSESIP